MVKTNAEAKNVDAKEKKDAYCVVCKSTDNVVEFKGKTICKACVGEAIAM